MGIFERTYGILLGTFLSEQYLLPLADRVAPLLDQEVTKAKLSRWMKTQRVDCIILTSFPQEMTTWIRELGHRVPEDLGVCLAQLYGKTDGFAGIDNQTDLLGEAAASFVVSLLQKNERGLPLYPRTISVEGRWIERPTVRPV
jgi:LacI family transcriptional regulator